MKCLQRVTRRAVLAAVCLSLSLAAGGCGGDPDSGDGQGGGSTEFISIGTAPQGGVFYTVGAAIGDVLDQNKGDSDWRKVTAESTGGSLENLRRLDAGQIQIGMSNSSITYFAVRGEGGFDKKYDVQSVMTLFPLIAMFVTKEDSGIRTIQDLKGRRVVVGPEGAGFEYFIRPILEEHGVSYDDFDNQYAGMGTSVSYLQDGSIDATFIGGGVKAPAIATADTTMDIFLIPYGQAERQALIQQYPSFTEATIPAGTYNTHSEEFPGMNVGSAHLVVRSDADEDFVYTITRIIYENRETVAEKHAAAKAITAKNVVRHTGVDFHPGAIKYYKEAGIWPDDSDVDGEADEAEPDESATSDEETEAPGESDE